MSSTSPTRTSTDPEVAAYARQVREALADVPAARLEELLEDLEEHLVEVASETPGPLTERLGSPAEYAAELRRAAGLPEGPDTAPEVPRVSRLSAWVTQVGESQYWLRLVAFLPELQPAWWVVRAWAAVAAVEYVFRHHVALPLPTLGLGVFGWLITGGAVVLSVRQGLRDRAAARPLSHRAAFANLALVICSLVALIGLDDRTGDDPSYSQTVGYDSGPTTLTHEDGTPITNIVPYGPDGEPLTGVLLYDQDGRPIDNLSNYTSDGSTVDPQTVNPAQPDNAYPQAQVVTSYDQYGNPVEEEFPAPTTEPTTTTEEPEPTPTVEATP